jgi:hypothetical protein
MRYLLLGMLLVCGCRKKAPPPTAEAPPAAADPAAAPAQPESPTVNEPGAARPAGDLAISFGPSKSDIHSAIEPLIAKIEKCAAVQKSKSLTALRFRISPKGEVDAAQIVGNPEADDCVTQVLSALRFTPWNGEPQLVGLPISPEGKLLRERPPGVD